MRKVMFREANYLKDKIELLAESERSIIFQVNKEDVRLFYKEHNLFFSCSCKHSAMKKLHLCSHIIAVLTFLTLNLNGGKNEFE